LPELANRRIEKRFMVNNCNCYAAGLLPGLLKLR